MTLTSQIITDAFRKSNLIAVGTAPTAAQQTEALRYLNRVVKSVFGNEAGDPLTAIPIGRKNISRPAGYPWYNDVPDNDWFVPKNVRTMFNLESGGLNLYLHPDPDDGSRFAVSDVAGNLATFPVTVHGNGRLIESAVSITLNTNGIDQEWFYRADLANWQKYAPLLSSDTFPFPEEFDTFFILMLAMEINPSFGLSMDDQNVASLARSKRQLQARYKQIIPVPSETALFRLSRMAEDRYRWGNSYHFYNPSDMFTKGWPW